MAKRKVKRERKLLYFMASWCGPCKHLKEYFFDDLAAAFPGQVDFIDAQRETALARLYKVSRIPLIVFLEDGKEVKRYDGSQKFGFEEFEKFLTEEAANDNSNKDTGKING